jgi:hypothetical protein
MKRECIEFPLDEFLKEFPQFQHSKVKLYVDLENAQEITDFLSKTQHAKKFRRILFEVLSLRYNDDLYGKEEVSKQALNMTAMKFSQQENMRIYCKEVIKKDDLKEKKVIMICLYYKKVLKSKKLQEFIETLGGYEYEFSS